MSLLSVVAVHDGSVCVLDCGSGAEDVSGD